MMFEIDRAIELINKRIFFCTWDKRTKEPVSDPLEMFDLFHINNLLKNLREAMFIYPELPKIKAAYEVCLEKISVNPSEPSDLYNLSKLMGESACLSLVPNAVVVRLSNVFGKDDPSQNFLNVVVNEAASGFVKLHTTLDSVKDYVLLDDVIGMLPDILMYGRKAIYNLAGGRNTSNKEIVDCLRSRAEVVRNADRITFPTISIKRLKREFKYDPQCILDVLSKDNNPK